MEQELSNDRWIQSRGVNRQMSHVGKKRVGIITKSGKEKLDLSHSNYFKSSTSKILFLRFAVEVETRCTF